MGHLRNLKEEYRELARRLNAGGTVAFVEPDSPEARRGWQELFEILYTPEQAAIAAKLPLLPETLPALAKRIGMPEADLRAALDPMCDKGLVMDLVHPTTGVVKYLLSPPAMGFIEFSMMRARDSIPKKRMAEALEAYMHGDESFLRETCDAPTTIGRTLVHETALADSMPDVLDWERSTALIENSKRVAVSHCTCRHKAEHLGTKCEAPTEICMTLYAGADFVIRRGFGREIERSEALEILAASRERGLVQTADNVQGHPLFLCNCCSCCCELFRAANEYGFAAVNPSRFLARSEAAACVGCGRCARACPVRAISLVPRSEKARRKAVMNARVAEDDCIGCGICVGACHKDAMHMVARETVPHVPVNAVERVVRGALEHGRLADLVFDQAQGAGARFLRDALQAILNLPPAKRLLAREQLRSRFVEGALARVEDPFQV